MTSRAALSTITLLCLSICSAAQSDLRRSSNQGSTSGAIAITVRDANGAPVGDARVEVRDSQMGMPIKNGYTNNQGSLELMGLPYDVYDVSVTKGLREVVERVAVQSMNAGLEVRIADDKGVDPSVGGKRSVSVAQFKVPKNARKEYDKAREAMKSRNVEEVEKHLAKALEFYPKYAEALTMRAIMKMDRNELESAAADLEDSLKYDAANATTYFVFGANLNLQSKFDQAIESLERGVSLNPVGWQGYFELGKANVGKQNYKQAIKYLDKALAVTNQEYPQIHLVKAHALLALKDYEPAMNELQAFLDKSPEDPRSVEARKALEQVKAFAKR